MVDDSDFYSELLDWNPGSSEVSSRGDYFVR